MENIGFRTGAAITECGAAGYDIAVRCDACSRTAVYAVDELSSYFSARHWSVRWPISPKHFVCRCRCRHISVALVPIADRPNPLPNEVVLRPLYRRLGNGWSRVDAPEPGEPAVIQCLRALAEEDPAKRIAWRVRRKGKRWEAEVVSGAPFQGADPLLNAMADSPNQALAQAVWSAVTYWRRDDGLHAPLSKEHRELLDAARAPA
ncbi:hypothetical protein ACFSCW_03400 [Sphingomonas tabacisoli]|uniref:Uncharacterized protein n=1 Tax=Sphingomonas tabacisoli TaxID=2249466 RepID=A0ABW4HYX4_9SPHN